MVWFIFVSLEYVLKLGLKMGLNFQIKVLIISRLFISARFKMLYNINEIGEKDAKNN